MNGTNPFEGLNPYCVTSIQSKARRLARHPNFTLSDIDDIEVELAIHLRQRIGKFDPKRGSFRTFVSRVLDNRAKVLIAERHTRYFNYASGCLPEETLNDAKTDHDDSFQGDLRADLQNAFALLTPEQRVLCERLSTAEGVTQIARELGVSRDTVYEWKRQVRQIFRKLGLQAYLGK